MWAGKRPGVPLRPLSGSLGGRLALIRKDVAEIRENYLGPKLALWGREGFPFAFLGWWFSPQSPDPSGAGGRGGSALTHGAPLARAASLACGLVF